MRRKMEKSDQEIKEILSKYLYSIQDLSLQAVVRNIIFTTAQNMDWQQVYKTMKYHMPELETF